MDRYQRVEKPREESPLGPNEIRITAQGKPRNYVTYALALLQVSIHPASSLAYYGPFGWRSFPGVEGKRISILVGFSPLIFFVRVQCRFHSIAVREPNRLFTVLGVSNLNYLLF
jgi:hypothetical protein